MKNVTAGGAAAATIRDGLKLRLVASSDGAPAPPRGTLALERAMEGLPFDLRDVGPSTARRRLRRRLAYAIRRLHVDMKARDWCEASFRGDLIASIVNQLAALEEALEGVPHADAG